MNFIINQWTPGLEDNGTELYSTRNERNSVVAEGFIRTLKKIIHKYMSSISKNVYIDKLDHIINKYKYICINIYIYIYIYIFIYIYIYHRKVKMKSIDVNSSSCIDFDKKKNKEDPKF